MAKFLQSLKYIITGKDDSSASTKEETTKDVTSELQLFIHQQAKRIKEHIEYENDLSENLPRDSKLIIKFDIDTYISEFDSFFLTKQLYSSNHDTLFNLTLQILVPPESFRTELSKEFRKKVYAGMLKNICLYKTLPVQSLTKDYYDKVTKIDKFNNVDGDAILELYKESVEILGKMVDQYESNIAKEPSFELDTNELLSQVVRNLSIRNKQDLENLLIRNRFLEMLFSALFLIILAGILLFFHKGILSFFAETDITPLAVSIYSASVIGLFVFLFMVRVYSYSKSRQRRKLLLAVINTLISELKINYGEVKNLFQEQFKFDIRKTRKIKKLEKKG